MLPGEPFGGAPCRLCLRGAFLPVAQSGDRRGHELGLDSLDASQALCDLVARGLAHQVSGRRYAKYLLLERLAEDPGLFDCIAYDEVRPKGLEPLTS